MDMEIESRKMRGRGTYGTNGVGDDLNLEVGHVGYIDEEQRCVRGRKREYERGEDIRVRLEKLSSESSQACTPGRSLLIDRGGFQRLSICQQRQLG